MQIVPVKVHGKGNGTFDTYALLDSGSQSTLIRDDDAKRLGLKGKRKFVHIATVKDQAESIQVEEFGVKVSSRDGEYHVDIDSVYATPAKKFNMPSRPSTVGGKMFRTKRQVEVASPARPADTRGTPCSPYL